METTRSTPRILFLTKYSRAGASSRYRTFQFLPFLREAGLDCEVAPLFDDRYLAGKYRSGRAHPVDVARALGRRLWDLLRVRRFDLVVIEYELLPYFPAWLEWLLAQQGVRYAVDYDDALFHQYDLHRRALVRTVLGDKIARVMRGAHLVTAGNEYLAGYATRAGAKWVEQVPTVVDLRKYAPRVPGPVDGPVTIGWIGSPATAQYLDTVAGPLAQVCRDTGARIRLIGAGASALPGMSVEWLAWNEATETRDIASFDVGIMPLADGPWEQGKCGFKLVQYMACGLPVVASPVGANRRIVDHGVHGFLAGTGQQWVEALTELVRDPALRSRMGAAGRQRAEESYSTQMVAPRLAQLLLQATGSSLKQGVKTCAESRAS